jgi:hypothetical protein
VRVSDDTRRGLKAPRRQRSTNRPLNRRDPHKPRTERRGPTNTTKCVRVETQLWVEQKTGLFVGAFGVGFHLPPERWEAVPGLVGSFYMTGPS